MKSMFDKFKNGDFVNKLKNTESISFDFVDNVERAMVGNDFEPGLKMLLRNCWRFNESRHL